MSENFTIVPSGIDKREIDERLTTLENLLLLDSKYETPWVACSVWTNQHLGDTVGGDINHKLELPLKDLNVRIFISEDGTDEKSFEVKDTAIRDASSGQYGITIFCVDNNNIRVQTGPQGLIYNIDSTGVTGIIDVESWYYKIVVTANKSTNLLKAYGITNDVMQVRHREAQGIDATPATVANAWTPLKFNHIEKNEINGATWNTVDFSGTLAPGIYNIRATHIFWD